MDVWFMCMCIQESRWNACITSSVNVCTYVHCSSAKWTIFGYKLPSAIQNYISYIKYVLHHLAREFKEEKVPHSLSFSHQSDDRTPRSLVLSFSRCRMFSPIMWTRRSTLNCTFIIETDVLNIIIMYFVSFLLIQSQAISAIYIKWRKRKRERLHILARCISLDKWEWFWYFWLESHCYLIRTFCCYILCLLVRCTRT